MNASDWPPAGALRPDNCVLPEVRREGIDEIQDARLHTSDPDIKGCALVWEQNIEREYLNRRARCCLQVTVRRELDSEASDYVAMIERFVNLGVIRCDAQDFSHTADDPHVRVNSHRVEGGDSQSPVPIQYREFFQDVMWGSRVELPDASDWVWVPSLIRLYRLDLVDIVLCEPLQLQLCAAPKGLGGQWFGPDNRESEVFPSAGAISVSRKTRDLPDDVVASSPEVAYDLPEVDRRIAQQLGIDLIQELNLAKSICVAIGFKSIATGCDNRLAGAIQRVHVGARPFPPREAVSKGVIHRDSNYAGISEAAP